MSNLAQYDDVVSEVQMALQVAATTAQAQGIYKWRIFNSTSSIDAYTNDIILDPGIGFAKVKEHNLELLRQGSKISKLGFPLLFGPSRKKFLGGTDPSKRVWGTAAAVTASVHQGADFVRVHDVAEMKQVVGILFEKVQW
jgi:dihydropteroate synthase